MARWQAADEATTAAAAAAVKQEAGEEIRMRSKQRICQEALEHEVWLAFQKGMFA